jgi:hypothetical protein
MSYDRNYNHYKQMKRHTQAHAIARRRSLHFCILYGTTEEITKRFSVDLYEKKEGCVDWGRGDGMRR